MRLVSRASGAIEPRTLRGQKITKFADEHAAVEAFIKVEWLRGIDGIQIAWDRQR